VGSMRNVGVQDGDASEIPAGTTGDKVNVVGSGEVVTSSLCLWTCPSLLSLPHPVDHARSSAPTALPATCRPHILPGRAPLLHSGPQRRGGVACACKVRWRGDQALLVECGAESHFLFINTTSLSVWNQR
jgi:hypothetical protein